MTRQGIQFSALVYAFVSLALHPLAAQDIPAQDEAVASATIARFIDNGDGTVSDSATGLTWLKDASCSALQGTSAQGRADWETAAEAAQALEDGQCGLADGSRAGDWRLPDVTEFCAAWEGEEIECPASAAGSSLVDSESGAATAVPNSEPTGEIFVDVEPSRYWTANTLFTNVAWFVDLSNGWVFYAYREDDSLLVWPVRETR